jgi:histone-lysine N-methyltransferase SETMAR
MVPGKFLVHLRKKKGQWFFHWDNAPVHTAAVVQNWLVAKEIQVSLHPLFSPDLSPDDFFLFQGVKDELVGSPSAPGQAQE